MFQFHKGSINTFSGSGVGLFNTGFNSIKVRLIQTYLVNQYEVKKFQFHKGSINTAEVEGNKYKWKTFQFHKGSINTGSIIHSAGLKDVSIP